jgi:hypothetical protein
VTTARRNITKGKPLNRIAVFADCQRRLSELSDLILRISGPAKTLNGAGAACLGRDF